MSDLFKPALISIIIGVFPAVSCAQTPSTSPAAEPPKDAGLPVKSAATLGAAELNGYKLAVWGMSKKEVKAGLHSGFMRTDPNNYLAELPWEILHLAGISESDPDDLLGDELEWFYGEHQDAVLGFYKNRFFFYTSSLNEILPVSEYEQKITANHGRNSRAVAFQNTDPAENAVTGDYNMKLWDKKKTTIILGVEKLFPGAEPETNYEITYLSPDIFKEFKSDFARALEQKNEAERKRSEQLFQEQRKNALEVIQ
ncbi:MAG: hypothetical protein KKH28_12615 [Elusimicrobia bacterium]|nr:hypothetical protein [Elusimicrobiota bacterium]